MEKLLNVLIWIAGALIAAYGVFLLVSFVVYLWNLEDFLGAF